MNVEIRIYKRFDTDILSLHDAGFSVSKMMTEALSAYANGLPCHFILDEIVPFDLNDKKSIRIRLKLKKNDYNTIALLQNIKHGYRSNFCKQVFRNALIQQNLMCYYSDISMLSFHEANLKTVNMLAYPGLKRCSDYRRKTQQQRIMGQDCVIQHEEGIKLPHTQRTLPPQHNHASQPMNYTSTPKIVTPKPSVVPHNTVSPVYMNPQPEKTVYKPEAMPQTLNTPMEPVASSLIEPSVVSVPFTEAKMETKKEAPASSPTPENNAAIMRMFDSI